MYIREMKRTDVGAVRKIAVRAWRDTYSAFIPEAIQTKVIKEAYSDEIMVERFKSSTCLITERDGDILGYAFFSGGKVEGEVFLESLYIDPAHQGLGIGKQLMIEGLTRFEGATTLALTVYQGNPNISFYEKQGFKTVKETQGAFFDHPVVFILMKKNLD